MKYYIKNREWEEILKILLTIKGIHKNSIAKLRCFVEAVWFMSRAGCSWRLLPDCYGSWRAIHSRFKNWSDKGIWEFIFKKLQDNPDMEYVMIDSTIVRAHASAAGYGKNSQKHEALGRSKGGFTTKIHALVDALGNPLEFILTPGQSHDITQAQTLTTGEVGVAVLADRGYDSDAFIKHIKNQGAAAIIPPRKNRKIKREYDKILYRERSLIECCFGKMKHFRRVFSRFDKTASTFLSFVYFVGALIWLR